MLYNEMTKAELLKLREELMSAYEEKKGLGLNLSMARGKPSKSQIELSMPMLNILDENTNFVGEDKFDVRNYGVLSGIKEAKKFFADILEVVGELPIPPYLNRETQESDKKTYQTVYSKIKGSVAAPTAGLHFTEKVLKALDEKGIDREELTLHVGAGTFKPVKSEEIEGHEMHTEYISVNKRTIEKLIAHGGKTIAVGTTSVRTLESLYYIGILLAHNPDANQEELHVKQWMPYENTLTLTPVESLQHILDYLNRNGMDALHTSTQIIIAPGYEYKIVKKIVTNFHQPQSTLLLLVSAFVKGDWRKIYDYALSHDFRFLSYGDSSLLIP